MKLLNLKAKNIFSIGEAELPLEDRGLILVSGYSYDENNANGAGKSSLANKAICWGLYGQTAGGVRADDVINRHSNNEPSSVDIDFIGADKKKYSIHRQRNPASLSLTQGNKDLSFRHEKETQALINSLLGIDIKLYTNTNLFGQGKAEFSFLNLPPADQKRIIEQILPLEKLSEWAANTKEAIRENSNDAIKASNHINNIKNKIDLMGQHKSRLEADLNEWELNRNREISNHEYEISKRYNELIELDLDIRRTEDAIAQCMIEIEKLSSYSIVNESTKQLTLDRDRVLKFINETNDIKRDLISQLSIIESTLPKDETVCGSCEQLLPLEKIQDNKEKIRIEKKRIKTIEKRISIHRDRHRKLDCELSRLTDLINKHELRRTITDKIKNLNHTRNELISYKNRITEKISDFKGRIKKLKEEKRPAQDALEGVIETISSLQREEQDLRKNHSRITNRRTHLEFWQDAYGTHLKNLLFDRVCPFLEERTNHYLNELGNPQIKVSYSTVRTLKSGDARNDFNISVESRTGGKLFDLMGGAEQQLTGLAVGLALSDLAETQISGRSQLLILDEPFMSLSPENCERVVNFLSGPFRSKRSTILLISNEDYLQSLIPSNVHVVKEKGISRIEER